MKQRFLLMAILWIFGQMVLAQSTNLPKHPSPDLNPSISPQARIFPNATPGGTVSLDLNLRTFDKSYRQRIRIIQSNRKSGKWTQAQEKTALDGLNDIRRQELQFFQQNKKRTITGDQLTQLNTRLKQWDSN